MRQVQKELDNSQENKLWGKKNPLSEEPKGDNLFQVNF